MILGAGKGESGPRRPGPLAGMALGAALGVSIFLLAVLVHDRLFSRRAPVLPPSTFTRGGDAQGAVRVLASAEGPGVQALLVPLREDGAPAEGEEAVLDGALFPGGPTHRWSRILVANPPGGPAYTLDLHPGAVSLETAAGRAGNIDLAAAVQARTGSLGPHRLLDLRVSRAAESSVEVPPGDFVRALVAFPREADPGAATGAGIAGGIRLLPREVPTESLRATLADGRVDRPHVPDRAEVKKARKAGGKE